MNFNNLSLNTLLGKLEILSSSYKNGLKDYKTFFQKNQGSFQGVKNTYDPNPGAADDPSRRAFNAVVTTVDEKLQWFENSYQEFIDAILSQERTNSLGEAKAELIVDGESWGELTSLELLRLKTLVESQDLNSMLQNIPVRSDKEIWNQTNEEMYNGRNVYESELLTGISKSVLKEDYILEDPNVSKLKDANGYVPKTSTRSTVVELGKYTMQKFSGEWSQRQRAEALARRERLLLAIVEALKVANEAKVIKSPITGSKVLNFLFRGK